ncbi:MAG: MAPEG family protein [Steroidobacteraceae bacterium]
MAWVQLVTLLALVQFIWFGILVGRARVRHGVAAPATTGHEIFERYYRVHMNTLETMAVFLPALWVAAQYWSPAWMAGLGAIYLVGRQLYLRGYVADPNKRGLGYGVSILPTLALLLAAMAGILRTLTGL